MSIATPLSWIFSQFLDSDGVPVSGGKLYSFIAGTSSPAAVFTDSTLLVPYSNPIILDTAGRPPGPIYPPVSPALKFRLDDANDVTVVGPWDAIIASAPSA